MKKIMVLFMVVFGLFLTGCDIEFEFEDDSDTAEITVYNNCAWQVDFAFVPYKSDGGVETVAGTVGKTSKTFTLRKGVEYTPEVYGTYDFNKRTFSPMSFDSKTRLYLTYDTYDAKYHLKSYSY